MTAVSPSPEARAVSRRGPLENLARFVRTPKGTLLLLLAALGALAAADAGAHVGGRAAALLLWGAGAAGAGDLLVTRLRRARWAFPSGALLSGALVALVLSPVVPVVAAPLIGLVAVGGKHLLRTRWSNVFNPAALALVIAALVGHTAESWWGGLPNLGVAGAAILVAGGWFMAARTGKLPAALTFLATALTLFTVASFAGAARHTLQIFRSPDIEMLLFFAGFMLTDPPTSPARDRDQVWYGVLVGAASAALFLRFGVQWFPLGGLLLGNLVESLRRLAAARRRGAARA